MDYFDLYYRNQFGRFRKDRYERLIYDKDGLCIMRRINDISAEFDLSFELIHFHEDVEFIYIISGSAGYIVNGKKIKLHAGEGIFVNAGQLHCITKELSEACRLYCLIFHPTLLTASRFVAENYIEPILMNPALEYILLSEKTPWHKKLIDEIGYICELEATDDSDLAVLGHIHLLWQILYQNNAPTPETQKKLSHLSTIREMVLYIEKHFNEPITLDDICNAGHIGKTCCTNYFKKYLYRSPNAFLNEYRLKKATEYLCNTDMNITEIAYACGYNGASYFTEKFREKYNLTPSEYRKMS
ncbi:MAG: AraC family transcriptional regulator [bacterium]|nr:AraC family transcriptional regulator [bacterium]